MVCNKCHNLPKSFTELLSKFENSGARWNCLSCTNNSSKTNRKLDEILEKVMLLTKPINNIELSLKLPIAEVVINTNTLSDIVTKSYASHIKHAELI